MGSGAATGGPLRSPAGHHKMPGSVSSLSRQLVLPVAGLVLAAVLANVGFSAWLATRRSLAAAGSGQEQVAAALAASRVAISPQVLDTLHRLTGSHFVVWNPATRTADAATLSADVIDDRRTAELVAAVGATAVVDGHRYRIGMVRAAGQGEPGTAAAHVPAKHPDTSPCELVGQPQQKRRAMVVGEAVREERDSVAGLPARGHRVVDGQRVAIVEIDPP